MDKDTTYELTDDDRDWIEELVAQAPDLTPEQRARLAALLRLR